MVKTKKIMTIAGHSLKQGGASSVNVEQFQVFTREELHAKIDGKEMDFEERDLLETLLVKKDENE